LVWGLQPSVTMIKKCRIFSDDSYFSIKQYSAVIAIIGNVEQVVNAFLDNEWDETELLTPENMIKAAIVFLSGSSYRHTIIGLLYCFGRQQDLSMQRPPKTISARNHLRLWMTSIQYNGVPVWIGQISRGVGVRMTFKTWRPFTHKISPAVDEAREYLVENMVISNTLAEFGFAGALVLHLLLNLEII